jgi:Cd2+/Zn2+-exporting ATPase
MHKHADDDFSCCGNGGETGESFFDRYHHIALPCLSGLFLLAGWILDITGAAPQWLFLTLYGAAYLAGGYEVLIGSLKAILRFRFDIDFLMLVAGIGAASIGLYAEGALLFFLFSLGHSLEHYAMGRARNAIRSLGTITPKTALRIDPDREHAVSVEELMIGDLVRIRPSSRVPVDGVVEEGTSSIDQAAVTGESMPVDRAPGGRVYAGSLNGDGALAVRVDRLATDTTMARMIKMVEESRSRQGVSQRFAQRFTRIYVPVILLGTLLLIFLPPALGILDIRDSFLRGMTVLVGASPCALAISTPSAVLAGIAQAARNGVLVKGGLHLENLGSIKVLAMDKTGTITNGRPEVTDIIPTADLDENQLLQLMAEVEFQSSHPLAKAISRAAQARKLEIGSAKDVTNLPGLGIHAVVDGQKITIGGPRLLQSDESRSWRGWQQASEAIERLGKEARSTMLAIREQEIIGVVGLADKARPNAERMIKDLHRLGIRQVVMLTGDNTQSAELIGKQVGVDRIESNLMPEDKIRIIKELRGPKNAVGMVGDGVNDAPALAAANVSIAMGAGGTDVALETANVALMADDLCRLPFAIGLSRRVRKTIGQNFFISMGVIAGLVPIAALGLAPIWIAVVFHEGSTLVVVLNALRLLGYRGRTT